MSFSIHTVSSFREFNEIILDLSTDQLILYRGQPFDKPLLPKIARYPNEAIRDAEKNMLEDFKRRSVHLLDHFPTTDWDWLALAQHHGMATRLLDWSENPLNALWFSIHEQIIHDHDHYAVVWGFHVPEENIVSADERSDPFEQIGTKIFKPNHITKRISVQLGWFTIHCNEQHNSFIPFEDNRTYSERLFKIKVKRECYAECQKRLHTFGINAAAMYPDVDGLAHYLEWFHLSKATRSNEASKG